MKRIIFYLCLIFTLFGVFAQTNSKTCTNIAATILKNDINNEQAFLIKWELPKNSSAKYLYIYKDTKQILSSSLKNLKPIAKLKGNATQYIEKITDSSSYYFAVLIENNEGLQNLIIPSLNATIKAISQITKKNDLITSQEKRITQPKENRSHVPLPYLNIETEQEKLPLSEEAKIIAQTYRRYNKQKKSLPLYIFPDDKKINGTGEQFLLSQIVNGVFIENDWHVAETKLKEFLNINRSVEITRRAHFYLGQVLYYQGYYREALNSLIIAEDAFPAKTKQWIQAVLEKMP